MASPASAEKKPANWWNYFFLYDSSKVKEEGDPTRAGICYFYPSQTLLDQQELLCGQIAGVVRCVSDISGSAPTLIRLRKLKFAIKVDRDYLWVLGCAVELPDVSCKQLLDQLIGYFRFYNGPISLAYKSRSRDELSSEWDVVIKQILNHTNHLDQIFNSLWTLDPAKVEPLLLLKATLILQACQHCPHVRAGCIIYQGLVVSTQFAPSLTAKVLLRREQKPPPRGPALQEGGADLPANVHIMPVFLTQAEAESLQEFPGEPMPSSPTTAATLQESMAQHLSTGSSTSVLEKSILDTSVSEETSAVRPKDSTACTLATITQPSSLDVALLSIKDKNSLSDFAPETLQPSGTPSTAQTPGPTLGCSLAKESDLPGCGEALDSSRSHFQEAQDQAPSSAYCPVSCLSIPEGGGPDPKEPVVGDSGISEPQPPAAMTDTAIRDLSSCNSPAPEPLDNCCPSEEPLPEEPCRPLPSREQLSVQGDEEAQGTLAGTGLASPASMEDSDFAGGSEARWKAAPPEGLVPMCLYTHSVNSLLLAVVAAESLQEDAAAIQEVYHSSLASLNGLEVHLKETLPAAIAATSSRAYTFAHYDRVRNVLTAHQPQAATLQERQFLQAVNLMHSDFAQLPALSEMTVRNASTAVYGCRSPAQETYFQQLNSVVRGSGFPSAQDSAFSLPGKARHRLLKHGVNLL